MKYQIEVLSRAKREFKKILRWLESRSIPGAKAWHAQWDAALEQLKNFADGRGLAPEDEDHEERIQVVYFKTRRGGRYRIVYTIRNDIVYVLAVRGPGQDLVPPDDLELPVDG